MDEGVEELTSKITNENILQVQNDLTNINDDTSKGNEVNNAPPASTNMGVCNENGSEVCEVDKSAEKVTPLTTEENNLQADYCSASNASPADKIATAVNEPATEVCTQEIIPVNEISKENSTENESLHTAANNAPSPATIETINETQPEVHAMDAIAESNDAEDVDNNPIIGIDVSDITNAGTIVGVINEPILVTLDEDTPISNAVIAIPVADLHVDGLQNLQIDYGNENSMMVVPVAGNPDVSELNENEEELLRGDAIGNTMYSSRFILSVLFELTKDITEDIADSELEDNLCTIWNMAMDIEVVKYMLQFDVLDIFFISLEKTNDKRLTELLIGIMGNMCDIEETIQTMYSKHIALVHFLLELCSCTDVRILEQLMRVWTMIFFKCDTDEEVIQWYNLVCQNNDFINSVIHILTNAFNKGVLLQTMDFLYIFLLRYSAVLENLAAENSSDSAMLLSEFRDRFIRSDIVKATAEALQTFLVNIEYASDSFEEVGSFEACSNERKFKQVFCCLHSILTKYFPNTQAAYEGNYQEVGKCLQLILEATYEESCRNGFKAWDEYEMNILQGVTDFITIAPFNETIVQLCTKIWYNIATDIEIEQSQAKNANTDYFEKLLDGESDFYEENAAELSKNLFSLLIYCIRKTEKDDLKNCFDCIDSKIKAKLIKNLENMEEANIAVRNCLDKLKT